MNKKLLSFAAMVAIGATAVQGADINVSFDISGNGYSSAQATARTLTRIDFMGSGSSLYLNTSCTDPFTITRDGQSVLSTLASEGKVIYEEDDFNWEEYTYISFSQSPFNQAGEYIISVPEGFFKNGSRLSNAHEQTITLTSPVPSSLALVVDGNETALTAADGSDVFSAKNVEVTGAGVVKLQGTTYYGAVNGSATTLTPGQATPIGYNGKTWTVPTGKYDVTVNWDELNPTVTFTEVKPVQTFDVTPSITGLSSTGTASSVRTIEFSAHFSFKSNTACTEPLTIKRGDEVIYSTLASEGKVQFEEDDWGDETVALYLNPAINVAGDYTLSLPEGFVTKTGGEASAAKEVSFKITWAAPASLSLRGSGLAADVQMIKSDDSNVYTANDVIADGQVRLQGSTYFGVANGQSAAITPGTPALIGYNGGFWTVPAGKYDVTVDWDAATVTFSAKPVVETFELDIKVQGATALNTAKAFQNIDLPAQFDIYYINNECTEPITVKWGDEVIFSIDRSSSKLLGVDNDDDWEDDVYMINLGERINRVGTYTISVPEGFFKNSTKVNAAVSKEVTVISEMPSTLSIRGRVNSGSLDAEVPMTLSGTVFTADKVVVNDADGGYGEIQLFGDSWYGVCNGQSSYLVPDEPAYVGYQGGFWKVAEGTYKVTVDWTDGNPTVTLVKDTDLIETIGSDSASAPAYYTMQGIRTNRPAKGQVLIEVRDGKASKICF